MKNEFITKEALDLEIEMISSSEHNVTYGISEENYRLGDSIRKSYGIVGYADAESEETSVIVISMRDLTYDIDGITELIDKCNRMNLSPIHLADVVEDFLNGENA